ncbi:MAG: DNA repair protein RecN [Betaproteobacteria bacterium]|nr:DNA repair protein RecN [Betaproteobacteria bacterium]
MLRRLVLRDVVIVAELELELGPGFTVLTGETGAGKSILIDALQLALGQRADAVLVREGATRAEVSAEFDSPALLAPWLAEAGFDSDGTLLLRRTVDTQGKSRAWINGSPATVAQLREAAEWLVDIHGQHAWQSLTRPAAVRALLDVQAGIDTAALTAAWAEWRQAQAQLHDARGRRDTLERERERLAWQIAELLKLSPAEGEWEALNTEHQRLAHGQALLDGARAALNALTEDEPGATALTARATDALDEVLRYDPELDAVAEVLRSAQAQLEDAAHTLHAYLGRSEPDPERLAELDSRIGAWVSQSRRYRRPPADLPSLLAGWQGELKALDAAADLDALEAAVAAAEALWRQEAQRVSALRKKVTPKLGTAVTATMQQLGMAGGRFEVALLPQDEPQAFGLEAAEFRVAGHAGSTPRPLAKVASGGELSRLALAIAVTTAQGTSGGSVPTLIFDEIDAGVGGTVADSVGRLMKQLGRVQAGDTQVLAVTHLAQVAACADRHFVVSKALKGLQTLSDIQPVEGEARVAEVARMLGGERLSGTAHAQALLAQTANTPDERRAAPKPAGIASGDRPTYPSAEGHQ